MTLRDILAVLRRRWLAITAAALAGLAGAGAVTLVTAPGYTATARVYFATHAPASSAPAPAGGFPDAGAMPNVFLITASDLQTYIQVMSSPLVADAVRTDLGLAPDEAFTLTADTPSNTPVLDVTATAASPEVAAAVANAAGPQLAAVAGDFSLLLASNGQTVESNPIAPALPPAAPSSPNAPLNLTIGLGLGLAAGLALAFARHSLDTRIRDEADLRTVTDHPVLSSVPQDKRHPLALESNPYGAAAEAVRRLRTNLRFVDLATESHAVVVTSALPQEGKTTTAVNLAIAMADAGSRVLLVDCDLRNPSIARTLDLPDDHGVTSVLLGDADLGATVRRWRDTSLWVLPAGPVPPNPSELLGSRAMAQLFERLRQAYDVVVVDSPPLGPVVDAAILGRLAGATLVVVGVDRIRKRYLADALAALDRAGAPVAGIALNKVPVERSEAYGYGYSAYRGGPATRPAKRGRTRSARIAASRRSAPSGPAVAATAPPPAADAPLSGDPGAVTPVWIPTRTP